MPGKIKVRILSGRNLPVMDRSSDTTDAYVEIKFGNTTYKTDVCRKSLNPQWNSEWYRFEVDDSELQDEPLQIKLMDHDTYSANDAIGKVYVNLNPLLLPGVPPPVKNIWTLEATMNSSIGAQGGSVMTGWVPVFDTMHGIRGEVNIIVKVELFLDFNKFRQSSCGVQFFYSPNIPYGYHAQVVHGFVEELIVSDDPEYKWIDKIRTPRASNEARQTLFFKLSGEVQRKIGLKALDLGGNAVIGYLQNFDLEGESGIVARGIGTAVTLVKIQEAPNVLPEGTTVEELATFGSKFKKHADNPDSDDNAPLLSHSPLVTPNNSPTNIYMTLINPKFPYYGRAPVKNPKTLMKVIDCRNQFKDSSSLRPFPSPSNVTGKKMIETNLSFSDDIIDESSIRNLLALEDLRGESGGNRFSRSLKNLKYLQQNVLSKRVNQFRSRMSESFDEESDGDSISSSTWSIGGTDSTRSSALDLRKNTRNKTFSRSKSANDGMVALLIKSVHVGFPASLDIVKEDRETPAPSPVKFLSDGTDTTAKTDLENVEKISDPVDKIFPSLDLSPVDREFSIPMISSSETDTSSDDEPSESSTNYNILDDTSSLNELVLPSLGRRIGKKMKQKMENSLQVDDKNELRISRKGSLQTERSTSTEPTSSDVDSDFQDKFEKLSTNQEENRKSSEDIKTFDEIDPASSKFDLEIPFKKLEEDNYDDEFQKTFQKSNFEENDNLMDNNQSHLLFSHLENSQEIETSIIPPLEFDYPESISLISPEEIETYNSSLLNDKNLELLPIIDTEEIEDYNFPLLEMKNPTSISEEIETYNEEIEDYNLPLLEANNIPLEIIDREESFHKNYESIDSNSDEEEENESINHFCQENRSTESIIIQPEKIETKIERINDRELKLQNSPDFDKSLFNNANIGENSKSDIFNEPFFCDNKSTDSINKSRNVSVSFLEDKTEQNSIIQEDYKIFNEPFFQDKNQFSLQSELNPKEKLNDDIFNEPFFKDSENSSFLQEDITNNTENKKSNKSVENIFNSSKIKELNPQDSIETNIEDNSSKFLHNTFKSDEIFEKFPLDVKTISNFQEQNFISFDITNEDVINNSTNDKFKETESNSFSIESFSLVNSDLSLETKTEELKIPTCFLQEIFDDPKNQLTEKRKSLIRQNSQYQETSILENQPFLDQIETTESNSKNTEKNSKFPKKLITKNDSGEKIARGVERSDTVIYKGPLDEKGRPLTPKIEKRQSKETITNSSPIIFVEHYSEKINFLKVPIAHTLDVNVKSTYTKKETELAENINQKSQNHHHQDEELKYAEILHHKFRKSCMLDLIKIIDTKMMTHSSHHSSSHRKDSFRCTKKRRDKVLKNLTPSPDSIQKIRIHQRRRSKSKSPEIYPNGKFPSTSTLNSIHLSHHSSHHSHHHHSMKKHVTHNLPIENTLKHSPDNSHVPIVMNENTKNPILDDIHKIFVDKLSIDNSIQNVLNNTNANSNSNSNNNNDNNNFQLHELKSVHLNSIVTSPKIVETCLENSSSLDKPINELVELTKNTNAAVTDNMCVSYSPPPLRQQDENSTSPVHANINNSLMGKSSQSNNAKANPTIPLHRRSSDSDLSITPKGNSLASSDRSMGGYLKPTTAIRTMNQDASDMLEYPFLTMQQYPPGFILHIGGLVSARSVKLLERISNLEEPEGRDAWWTEIRMEVRSHARALACNVVIGYREETSISDDVCVLNASGTAAVINLHNINQDLDNSFVNRPAQQGMAASIDSDREKSQQKGNTKSDKNDNETPMTNQTQLGKVKRTSESNDHEIPYSLPLSNCSLCHLPYSESSVPFKVNATKCAVCRRAKVPDVLFTTIELPENVPVTGRGCFVQAIVCKCKKDLRGELNAKEISDCLPFLEYELHSLLLNKLKVKGMNSIFGLKVQVSVGERLIIGMAIGTGVFLTSLPTPSLPQIASGNSWNNEEQLNEIQKNLVETVKKNREFYKLKSTDTDNGRSRSDTDESDDDLPDIDLSLGTKDACVLEVDDVEDMDRICLLMDDTPPDDFHVVNTQTIPGLEDLEIVRNLQMFTQVSRAKIPSGQFGSMPSKYFARLLQTVYFKLRRMVPCALCDMKFRVALPEQDEIQLSVVGMALGLGESSKHSKHKRKHMTYSSSKDQLKKSDDYDMIFTLDEDVAENVTTTTAETAINPQNSLVSTQKSRPRSPLRIKSHTSHRHKHVPLKERYGVDITPLSYLPGGRIERYLGNLNFFFIRESTSIRENGGISGFTHSFVNEVLAIVRAHVTTLGGNAMVAFFMTQCVLLHSPHKNHGQCLINVGGDVVSVSYFGDERQIGNTIC